MKETLHLVLLMLLLVFAMSSCSIINNFSKTDEPPVQSGPSNESENTEETVRYTVNFDLTGGEGAIDSVTAINGHAISLPIPTRQGYNFCGWFLDNNPITESTPITSDMTLTAKWEIKSFKVSFLDYYGNTVSTQTVNYGESATAPTVDSIIGKQRFDGWSIDFAEITEDTTVHAVYVNNTFLITYDFGGIAESFTVPCFVGETPEIPTPPHIDGYVFCGWFTDAELTKRYFFDHTLDIDTTLYAKLYDESLGEYLVISNVDQLMKITDQSDAKYLLACDINCNGKRLSPIEEFSGEINGNGYKIFNFIINESINNAGFVITNKGLIRDLSFSDFSFDVNNAGYGYKLYGLIAAKNEGIIINCHITDGRINYNVENLSSDVNYIGSIVGLNAGAVSDCINNTDIEIVTLSGPVGDSSYPCTYESSIFIGGLVGKNDSTALINKSYNYGKINAVTKCRGARSDALSGIRNGKAVLWLGGLAGSNRGEVDLCASLGDISSKTEYASSSYRTLYADIGGAFGQNYGDVENTFSTANITQSGEGNDLLVGGFVAFNVSKIYNCYCTGNVECNFDAHTTAGSFVGENRHVSDYVSTISKCFTIGGIYVSSSAFEGGYFVGKTSGTDVNCYYPTYASIIYRSVSAEGETIEEIEPTCTVGEAITIDRLTSADFIENTLYFDRMIWLVVDGKLPTLR